MNKQKTIAAETTQLLQAIIAGMQEKKAKEITILDLREVKKAVADYFVICTGTSDTHLKAIKDSVDEMVSKELQENPWHTEGKDNREWVLMDYVSIVAHIFQKEKREYYALEELWGDAPVEHIPDLG